jgi:hypothetical protein
VTPDELQVAVRAGIKRDRLARGLPERIEDPVVLARVAAIFVPTANPKNNQRERGKAP